MLSRLKPAFWTSLLLAALPVAGEEETPPAAFVDKGALTIPSGSVSGAVEYLKKGPEIAGLKGPGPCALTVMALLAAGVDPSDSVLNDALRFVREEAAIPPDNQYTGTYATAVSLMALHMAGEESFPGGAVSMLTRRLIEYQQEDGGWGDTSRSQFALYGLASARAMGGRVGEAVFRQALSRLLSVQNPDGGWPYKKGTISTGSMTAGALGALHVTLRSLAQGKAQCRNGGRFLSTAREARERGVQWMVQNLSTVENPGRSQYYYYYLYSAERALKYLDIDRGGARDWFSAAAERVIELQKEDGSWPGPPGDYPTQFALLFLSRSGWPAAISKLRWEGDWNRDPFDVEIWSEELSRRLHFPSEKRVVDLSEPIEYLQRSAVIYITGSISLELTAGQWMKLASFVENGGTLVVTPSSGGEAFLDSIEEGLSIAFIGRQLEPLEPDHAVYIVPYPINPEKIPVWGIRIGCRTGVFVFQAPLSCALSRCCVFDETGLDAEAARRLAYNAGYYALGAAGMFKEKEREGQEGFDPLANTAAPESSEVAFYVGWLKYDGNWAPFRESLGNLLRFANRELGRIYWYKPVEADLESLLSVPLLYVTGSEKPGLSEEEKTALRAYIEAGGRIVAEPACGDRRFVDGFRELMRELFPECRFERLPGSHPLYTCMADAHRVNYKKVVLITVQENLSTPWIEGIYQGQTLIALQSIFNLSGEWADKGYTHSRGYQHRSAYILGLNLLGYFFLEH